MEIREITTDHPNASILGYGIYVVLEDVGYKARLFHPVLFTEFYLVEYDYVRASGDTLWPNCTSAFAFNKDAFVDRFKKRIQFMAGAGKPFPVQTVAAILAALSGIEHDEALQFIGKSAVDENGESTTSLLSTKSNREYAIREEVDISTYRGRQYELLCAFKEHGSASIHRITALVDGKLKTKSDLGRVVTYFVNKLAREGILEMVT